MPSVIVSVCVHVRACVSVLSLIRYQLIRLRIHTDSTHTRMQVAAHLKGLLHASRAARPFEPQAHVVLGLLYDIMLVRAALLRP